MATKKTVSVDENIVADDFDFIKDDEVIEAPKAPKKEQPAKAEQPQVIVQMIDPAIAKSRKDADDIKRANADFRRKVMSGRKIAYKPPKIMASIVGNVYAWNWNGINIVVRFDGSTQYFPEEIYIHIINKFAKILDESVSMDISDSL